MPRVTQRTWADVLADLPVLTEWNKSSVGEVDLLIVAAGFEERARAVLQPKCWPNPKRLLVIEYPTNTEENSVTLDAFRGKGVVELSLIRYSKSSFVDDCRSYFGTNGGLVDMDVVVDLSGMSSYILFGVMAMIVDCCPTARLTLFYAEAQDYFPTKMELDGLDAELGNAADLLEKAEVFEKRNFQSRGIGAIYESEVFPGKNIGELPTRLVVVPNFSRDRTESMVTRAEALYNTRRKECIWLIGRPPDEIKNGWRMNGMSRLYLSDNSGIPVSTLDYREIARKLGEIWEGTGSEAHMVIVTLGSKMQHFGTFLFLIAFMDVGLVLSEPGAFVADRFSKGVGQAWAVEIGRISELVRLIGERGRLEFDWGR